MAANAGPFDIVIVGGGLAGLVLASRLSEDAELRVLVLEAGKDLSELPDQLAQTILTPAANTQLHKTPVDWNLKTVPQENLNGRELIIPQGKMLGGSSGLNGLLFAGSTKAVIDGWAELGNPGWEWPDFSVSLAKAYTVVKAPPSVSGSKTNGGNGPLKIAYSDECESEWPRVWADTIESLGYPGAQDILADPTAGGLLMPDTVDPALGIRSFANNAYLSPAVRGRANLTVLTGVDVKRVLLDKSGHGGGLAVATGVEYADPTTGTVTTVKARKEVIVSSGVFASPKLLELSGIGDTQRLSTNNIEVVVDLPGVGENLQNHPYATIPLQVNDTAPPTKDAFLHAAIRHDMEVLGGAMKEYMEHHTGPMASSGLTSAAQLPLPGLGTPEGKSELNELLHQTTGRSDLESSSSSFDKALESYTKGILSSPAEASGYYMIGAAYAALNKDGSMAAPPLDSPNDKYVTIVILLAHPLSRGSVHIIPGTAGDQPQAIDPRILSHPLDIEIMARHIQFVEKHLATADPLAKLVKPDGKRALGAPPAGALKDLDVARQFVKERAVGAHHYIGSCSMLPREMGGVVDPQLRVYGTSNLRVCDASIFPLIPRSGLQSTVYGVAEHGAGLIQNSLFSGHI